MFEIQKSLSFLVPMLDIEGSYNIVKTSYIGNMEYEGNDNWGDFIYLVVDSGLDPHIQRRFTGHPQFQCTLYPNDNEVMHVYKITEAQKIKIVDPFIRGKYSEIDSTYFYSHFSKKLPNERTSVNWMIYHKDTHLRRLIEDWVGERLPFDAELLTFPKREKEIYGYEHNLESV